MSVKCLPVHKCAQRLHGHPEQTCVCQQKSVQKVYQTYGAAPAHGPLVARPVHHGVLLLHTPIQAKGAVRAPHTKRKLLLQGVQRVRLLVSSLFTSGLFRTVALCMCTCCTNVQVHVDGHYHAWDRVSKLGEIGCLLVKQVYIGLDLYAHFMHT